jgi:7-cyano-7-deazaguanine synthase in queuosine biosynthesis
MVKISNIMQTIKFSNVDIDIHDGPLGIMLSGGADSSLLFYILMKYARGPIYVATCGNGRTNYHETVSASKVINKCIELTGKTDVFHSTFYVDVKTPKSLMSNNKKIFGGTSTNIIYNAFTRPPKKDIITEFDNDGVIAVGGVDPECDLPTYWSKNDNSLVSKIFNFDANYEFEGKFYTPFININKQSIASLYKELNILENLYPITRSCESLTLTSGHCGTCWWCKERLWAFDKLE